MKVDYAYKMEIEVLFYAVEGDEEDHVEILEMNKHYGK